MCIARQATGIQDWDNAPWTLRSIFRARLLAREDLCPFDFHPKNSVVSTASSGWIIPALGEANLESASTLDSNILVLRTLWNWQSPISASLPQVILFASAFITRGELFVKNRIARTPDSSWYFALAVIIFCSSRDSRYREEYRKFLQQSKAQDLMKKYKPVMTYLTERTGKAIDTTSAVTYLYNLLKEQVKLLLHVISNFKCSIQIFEKIRRIIDFQAAQNLTLPEWTQMVYPTPMKEIIALDFKLRSYTRTLKRLNGGTGTLILFST